MHQILVDIICPSCSKKACFKAEAVGTYKLYPNKHGLISCTHCGLYREHNFSNQDYYYQIDVGKRKLFAQNRDNLLQIRDFFQDEYKTKANEDTNLDFPKEFYQNKDIIVKRINRLLEDEQGYN